jgi:hypothetical protein
VSLIVITPWSVPRSPDRKVTEIVQLSPRFKVEQLLLAEYPPLAAIEFTVIIELPELVRVSF